MYTSINAVYIYLYYFMFADTLTGPKIFTEHIKYIPPDNVR